MKEKLGYMLDKLLMLLPDFITGSEGVMTSKYRKRYGNRDLEHIIHKQKRNVLRAYLGLLSILLICLLILGINSLSHDNQLITIERPEYGEPIKSIAAKAKIVFKEEEAEKIVSLKARQKELTLQGKKELLSKTKTRLPEIILGNNADLRHITSPLNLLDVDPLTGVLIHWSSSNPEVIRENGKVDLIEAREGEEISLSAMLTLDAYNGSWQTLIRISPELTEEDYKASMVQRLEEEVEALNKGADLSRIYLPSELGGGVAVEWEKVDKFNIGILLILFILAMMIVYMKRYDQIDKELKESRDSIYKDLPDFINKLVLLLNAGLVVNTALSKISEDYQTQNKGKENLQGEKTRKYLYEELCEIQKRVNQTKVPILNELIEFAQRTGVRELIRMVTIISDNLHKGSSLAEKLEAEGELLWLSRKKRAEEKGRLAETKLTFPLVLLLIILIMITLSPALMEM